MENTNGSSWLEINLDAIERNIQNIQKFVGHDVKIMGIVKGNAYGHDAIEISKILIKSGVNCLAVARIEEAVLLRKNKINIPILTLNISPNSQREWYFTYQIEPTISSIEEAEKFNHIGEKMDQLLKVHLKIDTGMGRLGMNIQEGILAFNIIHKEMKNILIEGIYSHFSTADEADKEYVYFQYQQFKSLMEKISKNGNDRPLFHIANSAAILDLPETWLDMVRPGCILYGYYPSREVKKAVSLIPALTFKTRISFIKEHLSGELIGYGGTYKTNRKTTVATLPVGYADGYPRSLSNCGEVIVKGRKAPVIGRVCMDQMMIDITGISGVEVGDEVILWGAQSGGKLSIEKISDLLHTVPDEVVHLTDKARVAKAFLLNGERWKMKYYLGIQ